MNLLRALLVALILYVPNMAQVRVEFPVRGLNILNLLTLGTLLVLLAVRARTGVQATTETPRLPPPPMPLRLPLTWLAALLVWAFLVGIAQDASSWVEDLTALKTVLMTLALYPLVYHAVQDARTVRRLVVVVMAVTLFAGLLGLRQALDYGLDSYNETRRVAAPFGWNYTDANRSAIFFAIFMPLLGAWATIGPPPARWRWVAAAGLALCVFVTFFTYSRQAYGIVAVLMLLLMARRSWLLALGVVLALATFEHWAPETVVARVQSTTVSDDERLSSPTSGGAAGDGDSFDAARYDASTESRWQIWEGAAEMIGDRPWGVGLNHFKRSIGAYAPRFAGMDAHNHYVLITAEAGVLAPLVMAGVLIALWRLARRAERVSTDAFGRALGWGFTLSVIAVLLGNLYGSRFLDEGVMGNFWILAALVARHVTLAEAQPQSVGAGSLRGPGAAHAAAPPLAADPAAWPAPVAWPPPGAGGHVR